jgi:predicted metalloprotease with PDZ domain
MGKVPVTPVVKGKPVTLVSVPLEGVPSAPPLTTNAPDDPTFTARAVATLVPRPDTPVDIGKPVALVNVAETGVPRAVTLPDALSCGDREAAIVSITFLVPAENVTADPALDEL